MRYVDLMGGQKPHLLVAIGQQPRRRNPRRRTRPRPSSTCRTSAPASPGSRGCRSRCTWSSASRPIDRISRNRFVTRYAYHHGYFDGVEREFRGFGMVEQWDTEEYRADQAFPDGDFVNWDAASWCPPVLTRTWFHTGAFEEAAAVSRQFATEYWVEPALRPDNRAADRAAMELPDTAAPSGLNAYETREAYRALKGQMLRSEVYASDGAAAALEPLHRHRAQLHHSDAPARGQ